MIRIVSVALPKSPTNLAQGDEVPQIITRITRQRPSEILHLLQNDFCNTIGTNRTWCDDRLESAFGRAEVGFRGSQVR
jgi:hypothetical protein